MILGVMLRHLFAGCKQTYASCSKSLHPPQGADRLNSNLCGQVSFFYEPQPLDGCPMSAPGVRGLNMGVFRMLSLNWQRTFDGAAPRLVQPTLACGEHGAPVQGAGPVGNGESSCRNYPATQDENHGWAGTFEPLICFRVEQPSLRDCWSRAGSTQDFILGYLQPSLRDLISSGLSSRPPDRRATEPSPGGPARK